MKEYTLLHPLVFSFFSRSLYRDVAWNWKGLGFLYLLLLLTLAWIPATVALHRRAGALIDQFGPLVAGQVPAITITDGEVSLQEPQPYVIKIPGRDAPLAVIDTTGQTSPRDMPGAAIFLTRRELIVRQERGESRVFDLSSIKSFTLDRGKVEACGRLIRRWLAVALYPLLLLGSYVYRILQALLYGALGILFARLEKADLEYPDLVRLSCVAVTPAVVLDTLRGWMGVGTTFLWWFACFAITTAYLFLAVRFSAEPPAREPASPGGVS